MFELSAVVVFSSYGCYPHQSADSVIHLPTVVMFCDHCFTNFQFYQLWPDLISLTRILSGTLPLDPASRATHPRPQYFIPHVLTFQSRASHLVNPAQSMAVRSSSSHTPSPSQPCFSEHGIAPLEENVSSLKRLIIILWQYVSKDLLSLLQQSVELAFTKVKDYHCLNILNDLNDCLTAKHDSNVFTAESLVLLSK